MLVAITLAGLGFMSVSVLLLAVAARAARAAKAGVDTIATIQILFCDLDGEASLIDCVTMHEVELGAYSLPSAAPLSLVATDATPSAKRVLKRWAEDGRCVNAGFGYKDGATLVHLSGTDATVSLGLVGALG